MGRSISYSFQINEINSSYGAMRISFILASLVRWSCFAAYTAHFPLLPYLKLILQARSLYFSTH